MNLRNSWFTVPSDGPKADPNFNIKTCTFLHVSSACALLKFKLSQGFVAQSLLNQDLSCLVNSVGSDQIISEEAIYQELLCLSFSL